MTTREPRVRAQLERQRSRLQHFVVRADDDPCRADHRQHLAGALGHDDGRAMLGRDQLVNLPVSLRCAEISSPSSTPEEQAGSAERQQPSSQSRY